PFDPARAHLHGGDGAATGEAMAKAPSARLLRRRRRGGTPFVGWGKRQPPGPLFLRRAPSPSRASPPHPPGRPPPPPPLSPGPGPPRPRLSKRSTLSLRPP